MDSKFEHHVNLINNNKINSNASLEVKLKLYGLYKQATKGDAPTSSPGFWYPVEYSKWSAWDANRGLSQNAAKNDYVEYVKQLILGI
jgi:diazepam-binding inhibitor (GABA receptor modulating acyl-CoA-binding protein)